MINSSLKFSRHELTRRGRVRDALPRSEFMFEEEAVPGGIMEPTRPPRVLSEDRSAARTPRRQLRGFLERYGARSRGRALEVIENHASILHNPAGLRAAKIGALYYCASSRTAPPHRPSKPK